MIDGMDIPVGALTLRWWWDVVEMRQRMVVDEAAPIIRLSAEWVAGIKSAQDWHKRLDKTPWVAYDGHVLTVNPTDGDQVIYRQVAYEWQNDTYVFAWPD